MRSRTVHAVAIALPSALFFTLTYVLSRAVVSGGGHWLTLPLLAAIAALDAIPTCVA